MSPRLPRSFYVIDPTFALAVPLSTTVKASSERRRLNSVPSNKKTPVLRTGAETDTLGLGMSSNSLDGSNFGAACPSLPGHPVVRSGQLIPLRVSRLTDESPQLQSRPAL